MNEQNLDSLTNTTIRKIIEYKDSGFLFHGSPNSGIDILEPRLTSGASPEQGFNYDTAVFATNDVASSIVFAVVNKELIPAQLRGRTWYMNWYQFKGCVARIPNEWKPYIENNIGSLYVLNKETFTKTRGAQFKSHSAVIPTDKVNVRLQDAIDLGATVEWV